MDERHDDTGETPTTGTEPLASRRSVLGAAGFLAGGLLAGTSGAETGSTVSAGGDGPSWDETPADCGRDGDASSPPPGPPALYRDQPTPPQFENTDPWSADPLRVCGTDAYVDGEYLFQDFIYDDNGANTTPTIAPPNPAPDSHTFGPMSGDVVYPTGDDYVGNAADLLEFRTTLAPDGRVRYRFTLTTMRRADAAAIAVGIDSTGTGTDDWGYGIGSLGTPGLDHVLVIEVRSGGPAAGVLQAGDVVVSIDGKRIDSRQQLASYLALESSPGDTVELAVRRDGERRTVELTLGERPE